MKIKILVILSLGFAYVGPFLNANDIGFVEKFALSSDRSVVLRDLIPGTRDYYYYHALHAQNQGRYEEVEALIAPWIKRYGQNNEVREIRNRNALLSYDKNPAKTLEYLRRNLGLNFNHSRIIEGDKPTHPTRLNSKIISYESFYQDAVKAYDDLQGFETHGLRSLDPKKLNGVQLRDYLKRTLHPDVENLTNLIEKDLNSRQSEGFGSLEIHRKLTKLQMEALLEKNPHFLHSNSFVQNYLLRLLPSADLNPEVEPQEKSAWLNRQLLFTRTLPPSFNSLKANVLYNVLLHKRSQGAWNRELLLEYLALPRPVAFLRAEWNREQLRKSGARPVNLNEDFRSYGCFQPVVQDLPLIRSMLLHFFSKDPNFEAFSKFLTDEFLKPIFAEAKLTAGLGNAEKWYSMLSTGQLKNLRDRTDLSFAPDNPSVFAPKDEVNLKIWTKNVRKLLVKEFELNAFNFYLKNGREIDTAIELDGLSATRERTIESDLPPIRRSSQTISFPDLKKRGVYVVEFIGNGISSRALIRKGTLRLLEKIGPAGHEFRILDENNQICENATLWLDSKEYSHQKGVILIPFSNNPGPRTVILRDDDFASLARFNHLGEKYALQVGFHLDRESLGSGKTATLLVRPSLRLNGYPASLDLLEQIKLSITTFDHESRPTRIEVPIAKLDHRAEFTHEFRVPERTHRIETFLEAKIESLTEAKKVHLRDEFVLSINDADHGYQTANPHLVKSSDGYFLEILGKNGEPFADLSVPLVFKHLDFRKTRNHTLKTDEKGRIELGLLPNLEWLQARAPQTHKWELGKYARGHSQLPNLVHAKMGESVFLPFPRLGNEFPLYEFSLLEKRAGAIYADQSDKIRSLPGLIQIVDLPAGNFEFHHHPTNRSVGISVTRAEEKSGFLVSPHHILERNYAPPLSISSLEAKGNELRIRLVNAHSSTRLHVMGTAFLPSFNAHPSLRLNPKPDPVSMTLATPRALFVEGRDIGEEYRYVLERQGSAKFSGNMLARPGLLLNPWSVRSTETDKKEARGGNQYEQFADAADLRKAALSKKSTGVIGLTDPFNLDFLKHGTLLFKNLRPNKNGEVVIEVPEDKGYRMLRLVAIDPLQQVGLDLALPDCRTLGRELRMMTALDFEKAHAKQKRISILENEKNFEIEDLSTSRFRSIDSLRDAYDLFLTLNESQDFRKFEFLLDWHELKANEKMEKYQTHACHELHFFIYRKDRTFFDEVIKPYLANKKEPNFLDEWFLERDLSKYLHPLRFDKLNAFEKALLSTTRFASAMQMSRHLAEKSELIASDPEHFDRLFEIALQSAALETQGGELERLAQTTDHFKSPSSASAFAQKAEAFPAASPPAIGARRGLLSEALSLNVAADSAYSASESRMPLSVIPEGRTPKRMDEQRKAQEKNWFAPSSGFGVELGVDALSARLASRPFYRKIGKVMEWAESNYYRVEAQKVNASLIPANSFWSDYARHLATNPGKPFLSGNLIYATSCPNEMLLALSVLDLPFVARETKTEIDGKSLTITPKQDLLLYHEQLLPSELIQKSDVLMSQRFFRHDSRYRFVKGERIDNFVDGEFLAGIAYGSIVVLTNPTSSRQNLRLLLHLPNGSMPLGKSRRVRSIPVTLEAYSTQTFESSFYFPSIGEFGLYPAQASSEGKSVASTPPVSFKVVRALSKKDETSWSWISQNGSVEDVFDYLRANNLNRIDLNQVAFRLRREDEGGSGKSFYDRLLAHLDTRFHYHDTTWSYAFYHQDQPRLAQFLAKSSFARQCGLWLECPLLKLDPTERNWYEQLEYAPLVHARAHRLGKERQILNDRLRTQYSKLLEVLKYKPSMTDQDHLALTYYLFAQDRIAEGLDHFDKIDRRRVKEKLQYDYFAVNASLYRLEVDKAENIAKSYQDFPVDRWKKLFGEAIDQIREAKLGPNSSVEERKDRNRQMDRLADSEPTFSFEFMEDQIRIEHKNLKTATVRFYPMEVELLFSRQPFAQNDADHFTLVAPDEQANISIASGETKTTYSLPEKYRRRNVMIEIEAGGKTKAKAYYSNQLQVEVTQEYGRLRVLGETSGKPLAKVYVKVYARMINGQVRFYKDGYTDLRGKFEYASLNTNDLDQVSQFALLLIHPTAGAQIEEAPPPYR